ncbi:MAG TPA: 6-phosphogluconolactonase [Bryobacteraceae bacterium]|jgi:6-phosphogluconolactonase|nr:6-phosphogluconolactonase [Bryobacteraceae bacterium]
MADSLRISATAEEVADAAAQYVLETLSAGLKSQPHATLAISGGSSPKLMFRKLAASGFDWSKVHIFWVDERCVPPNDDQSNFKLADETLLSPARISKYNVHRIHGEMTPEEAAVHYIEEIETFFQLREHELPVFDLIHRGIGPDAHTASLFPGNPLIANRTGIAAAVWVEKMRSHRVTLLPGVLLAARHTLLQVAGPDKTEAVYNILKGPEDPFQFPGQIATRGSDKAVWFLDKAAASKL